MKAKSFLILFLLFVFHPSSFLLAQHTFSIVAVDSVTGQIGSAGATCGDSIIWPGLPGALIISDVLPGIGAIHTQAYWNTVNQANAHSQMVLGNTPQQIIDWLVAHDAQNNPAIRQYGIADYNGGHPRSAGYTGSGCQNYKNHLTGPGYSIQGNILLGPQILDSMRSRYLGTQGSLAEKLMAALQGAKVVGADTRCTQYGTSSLSAFIRVANPGDDPDTLYLHINVPACPGQEPIDVLQSKFNTWLGIQQQSHGGIEVNVYPNPAGGRISIRIGSSSPAPDKILITDSLGRSILHMNKEQSSILSVDLSSLAQGMFFLNFYHDGQYLGHRSVVMAK